MRRIHSFATKRAAEQNEDLRALLNAGFQQDRPALRCVGPQQIPTPFPTFAMAVLAGIGKMPDTISDRGPNIGLRRRASGEKVSQFRSPSRRQDPGGSSQGVSRLDDRRTSSISYPMRSRRCPSRTGPLTRGSRWWRSPTRPVGAGPSSRGPRAKRSWPKPRNPMRTTRPTSSCWVTSGGSSMTITPAFVASSDLIERAAEGRGIALGGLRTQRPEAGCAAAEVWGEAGSQHDEDGARVQLSMACHDAFARYLRPEPSERPNTTADQQERGTDQNHRTDLSVRTKTSVRTKPQIRHLLGRTGRVRTRPAGENGHHAERRYCKCGAELLAPGDQLSAVTASPAASQQNGGEPMTAVRFERRGDMYAVTFTYDAIVVEMLKVVVPATPARGAHRAANGWSKPCTASH